jgi:hypothetical protein
MLRYDTIVRLSYCCCGSTNTHCGSLEKKRWIPQDSRFYVLRKTYSNTISVIRFWLGTYMYLYIYIYIYECVTSTASTSTTTAALPDSIRRVGKTEAFPNEYPGQNYAFNWCLNGDGVTPLKKSAFRITKPLDLKIAGLKLPAQQPLQVRVCWMERE